MAFLTAIAEAALPDSFQGGGHGGRPKRHRHSTRGVSVCNSYLFAPSGIVRGDIGGIGKSARIRNRRLVGSFHLLFVRASGMDARRGGGRERACEEDVVGHGRAKRRSANVRSRENETTLSISRICEFFQ